GEQAAVRREQREREPALVDRSAGRALAAADVVAPEPEPAQAQAQAAAQRLGHRFMARRANAALLHGEALARRRRRAREHAGGSLAALLLEGLDHGLLVQVAIMVAHRRRVGA